MNSKTLTNIKITFDVAAATSALCALSQAHTVVSSNNAIEIVQGALGMSGLASLTVVLVLGIRPAMNKFIGRAKEHEIYEKLTQKQLKKEEDIKFYTNLRY